jgi:hypothetical protein
MEALLAINALARHVQLIQFKSLVIPSNFFLDDMSMTAVKARGLGA